MRYPGEYSAGSCTLCVCVTCLFARWYSYEVLELVVPIPSGLSCQVRHECSTLRAMNLKLVKERHHVHMGKDRSRWQAHNAMFGLKDRFNESLCSMMGSARQERVRGGHSTW